MNPKDEPSSAPSGQNIQAPAGIDLHPKPERTVRLSKLAGMGAIVVGLGILAAFAYGGYQRQQRAQVAARDAGLPSSVAPATTAGNEFIEAIPLPDAGSGHQPSTGQLQPPGTYPGAASRPSQVVAQTPCGWDPRTGQPYRFNPQTGQPCPVSTPQNRAVVRQAPPLQYTASSPPSAEEQRLAAAYQRELEAMTAPTGIRTASGGGISFPSLVGASPVADAAQLGGLRQALATQSPDGNGIASLSKVLGSTSSATTDNDYEGQNMQTRKEAFLVEARSQKTNDYLRSTRSAPLGMYEIKAGWEIPAVLEQSLNSDLPGDIKALISSNVFDTATGKYLLVPQGSRLVGKYDSRISYGQDGVQVAWDRIIFPDASSVDINGMVGLDAHGNSGLRYDVDHHYKRLFGFAALTSAFSAAFDLSQRNTQSALTYPSVSDTARAAVGREMSQTGAMVTRRNLNVQPTIKVPAGYKFTVRVNRDILFDAPYQPMEANPLPIQPPGQLHRRSGFSTTRDDPIR